MQSPVQPVHYCRSFPSSPIRHFSGYPPEYPPAPHSKWRAPFPHPFLSVKRTHSVRCKRKPPVPPPDGWLPRPQESAAPYRYPQRSALPSVPGFHKCYQTSPHPTPHRSLLPSNDLQMSSPPHTYSGTASDNPRFPARLFPQRSAALSLSPFLSLLPESYPPGASHPRYFLPSAPPAAAPPLGTADWKIPVPAQGRSHRRSAQKSLPCSPSVTFF